MLIKSGLVSVTFRQLTPERIISLVQAAGLEAIEWGGDIHVPHGDIQQARRIGRLCREAGISCCAYGSYCRLTNAERQSGEYERVIETAGALGASAIRVWAGAVDSQAATSDDIAAVVANARCFTDLARAQGLCTAYEFHGGTLTSTGSGALQLLRSVPGSYTYWQPPQGAAHNQCLTDIANLLPYIANIHVFSWNKTPDGVVRLPLSGKTPEWEQYLQRLAALDNGLEHTALLEFVAGDSEEQFLQDAAELRRMLKSTALLSSCQA